MDNLSVLDAIAMFFTTISLIFTFCTVAIHLVLKEMLKHPGQLVFYQCIAQFIIDLHWYTTITGATK